MGVIFPLICGYFFFFRKAQLGEDAPELYIHSTIPEIAEKGRKMMEERRRKEMEEKGWTK